MQGGSLLAGHSAGEPSHLPESRIPEQLTGRPVVGLGEEGPIQTVAIEQHGPLHGLGESRHLVPMAGTDEPGSHRGAEGLAPRRGAAGVGIPPHNLFRTEDARIEQGSIAIEEAPLDRLRQREVLR